MLIGSLSIAAFAGSTVTGPTGLIFIPTCNSRTSLEPGQIEVAYNYLNSGLVGLGIAPPGYDGIHYLAMTAGVFKMWEMGFSKGFGDATDWNPFLFNIKWNIPGSSGRIIQPGLLSRVKYYTADRDNQLEGQIAFLMTMPFGGASKLTQSGAHTIFGFDSEYGIESVLFGMGWDWRVFKPMYLITDFINEGMRGALSLEARFIPTYPKEWLHLYIRITDLLDADRTFGFGLSAKLSLLK